ncbi:methyl-CpG-binding domain-containing protein 13 [Cinnamomum micranthum f. kanehirae]|uniref:Methyl-CpG-binding domain-containing protein 13 n=1 Tax=Cinnamomum micranthum f. kanehirae TaxID=337451 RepID=A0A3S3PJH7_9MAGN|nr:methyl-CpG-binding domain-containing protein 13 [Cinnamomum micranthum f. kanehirae]
MMSDSGQHWPESLGIPRKTFFDRPEWLPEGWKVEIKTRKGGWTAGRKDKYYIDPMTGCKLRSKDEVIRYLTGEPSNRISQAVKRRINTCTRNHSNHTSQPVKRSINMCTRNLLLSMESSAEWLPLGWITEIKTRKHGQLAGEKYKVYIAPYTGCRFYSKNQVLYYLETGNISRQSRGRKKRSINALSIDRPPCSTERRKLANTTARRCIFGSQSLNSNGTTPEFIGIKDAELGSSSLRNTQLPNNLDGDSINYPQWSLESEHRKLQEKVVLVKFEKMHLEDCLPLEPKEKKSSENGVPREMAYSRNHKLPENGLFEGREQLEGAIPLSTKDEKPLEHWISLESEDKKSSGNGLEKQESGRECFPSSSLRVKKAAFFPRRASKRLAALKAKVIQDLANQPSGTDPSDNSCASNIVEESHSDKPSGSDASNNTHCEKPCTGESMAGVENEKVFHKDPESPLVYPFGDSWPDPCIEFAFKTLTGAIPVVEENSSVENYFQQQLGLAQVQGTAVVDGLFQTQLPFQPTSDSMPRFLDDKIESDGKENFE